jgi:hypothetical protein
MRSSLLYLFTFFIAGIANAQGPTLTSAETALPGDIFTYAKGQITGVATPATGANVTWDYSGLIDSAGIEIDSFISPSATPYASLFSGTNLASTNGGGNGYSYYETNTSEWAMLGSIDPGSDTSYFLSSITNIHFPFSYGSSFTDSSKYVIREQGLQDTFEYKVVHLGIGYGTLKIPGQTFSNVVAFKTLDTERTAFGAFESSAIYFATTTTGVRSYVAQFSLNAAGGLTAVKYLYNGSVTSTTFTFNGTGEWSNSANWAGKVVPTSPVPSGTQITISPQAGGACTLDVPVIISSGATLTVSTGAAFKVQGNLIISK